MNPTRQAELQGMRPHDPEPRPWEPLVKVTSGRDSGGPFADYQNTYYDVTLRRLAHGVRVVMIVNKDQSARRDFREFQAIKNQLLGREAEAVELYPAESRLHDPSNAFFLWCPRRGLGRLGLTGKRTVLHPSDAIAPQRRFA